MKKFFITCSVLVVVLSTLWAAGYGLQELRSGDALLFKAGSYATFEKGAALNVAQPVTAPTFLREIGLGTPAAAEADAIVTSTSLKVGSYTNNLPFTNAVARNLSVTTVSVNASDTVGTLVVVGTDISGEALSETITLSQNATATGSKAFKTVTSLTGAGWVAAGGNDTVTIGTGSKLGLPVALPAGTTSVLSAVGTAVINAPATAGAIPVSTVDASASTYDGVKEVKVYPAY